MSVSAEIAYALGGLGLVALVATIIVACAQVVRRYNQKPLLMAGWLALILLMPFIGAIAWFVWDGWVSQLTRDSLLVRCSGITGPFSLR